MTDRRIKNKYIMISEKLSEAAKSVIPIVAVVLVLSLTIAPIPTDLMLSFLLGTLFLVLGMGLFSLGAEMSMTPIGSKIGTSCYNGNFAYVVFNSRICDFAAALVLRSRYLHGNRLRLGRNCFRSYDGDLYASVYNRRMQRLRR